MFVLIKAAPTLEEEVGGNLKSMKEVEEVDLLFGEFDVIAKLKGEDTDALGDIVVDRIRGMEGVEDTKSLRKVEPDYER